MVPANLQVSKLARDSFEEQARNVFSEVYYAENADGDEGQDRRWTVGDVETQDAPHQPIPIHYSERLVFFHDIAEIADPLSESSDHRALMERIDDRFAGHATRDDDE